ncbi:MAG: alpha/beta fold hydrolase [Planctomycetaceae bacterium]|nr:alpha/beta fold hydrolase [Planctomycetales bacterium]MCB9941151.1 alpha/beta fold hydrolase [Planctomycetaceae bacterium]
MKTVKLHDATLSFTDVGTGPVLLLVHGFPLDHSMWQPQLESLSDTYRIIAPDLRGFGASGGATETITMEQFADDMAALLDALGINEPITFCGLSMGGYVAWQFWRRHAARLSRLILCDTRAIADSEEVARGRAMMAERVLSEGSSIVAEAMLPKLFAEATARDDSNTVEATHRVMAATAPAAVAGALRGMALRPDMTKELPNIDVPTLVICGEHDVISPPDEMRSIADKLPNATFVEIAGSGHMSPLEAPAAVNAAIRDFLA